MKYERKKLEELNLLDNFLFGSMVTHPEFGEEFSRELLQVILQRKFQNLTVFPQKVYYGSDTNLHGARLDVYLEDENEASIYDIEPDKKDDQDLIAALPRRVRFYHAKMDGRSLKSGEKYTALKNVIIIMIMPYDPFGRGRMVYTVQNACVEDPSMPYEDGAKTVFLYTKGKIGIPSEELKQLLTYMEQSTEVNATNDMLKGMHRMVEVVKHDEEVSVEYMRKMEEEDMLMMMGREEGLERGRQEGLERGREEGLERGREEGLERGRQEGTLFTLCELVKKGVLSEIVAAEEAGMSVEMFREKVAGHGNLGHHN